MYEKEWAMAQAPMMENKKGSLMASSAVRTRLELVTSCVTGRHSNLLN